MFVLQRFFQFCVIAVSIITVTISYAKPLSQEPAIAAFIDEEVKQDHFNKRQLQRLFNQVKFQQSTLDHMNRPHESKPWHEYRRLFVNDVRITNGLKYWKKHKKTLENVSKNMVFLNR